MAYLIEARVKEKVAMRLELVIEITDCCWRIPPSHHWSLWFSRGRQWKGHRGMLLRQPKVGLRG
eukprot:10484180-Karenia_brevis.AAC.1